MAVCIVVWIVEAVLNLVWQGGLNAMLNAGMLMPATAVHKPWTFITSMFLHQPNSLWHILFNMLTLWCVGPVLERMMGHWSFLALYAVSGLAGGTGMMLWACQALPVGLRPYMALPGHCSASSPPFWWFTVGLVLISGR